MPNADEKGATMTGATEECPHRWVEDGRAAVAVRSREVRVGDVLLCWNGESWDLGRVLAVEVEPRQWFGGVARHGCVITTDAGASYRDDGAGWRRVARRRGRA